MASSDRQNSSVTIYITGSYVYGYASEAQIQFRTPIVFPSHDSVVNNDAVICHRMLSAYRLVIAEIRKYISVSSVTLIVGYPWSSIEVVPITYDRSHDFRVTKEQVATCLRPPRETCEMRIKDDGMIMQMVSFHPETYKLNGYMVDDPWGSTVRKLSIDVVAVYMNKTLYSEIMRSTILALHTDNISIYHEDILISRIVRAHGIDALVFNLGVSATTIMSVNQEGSFKHAVIQGGTRDLAHVSAHALHTDITSAMNLLHMMWEGHLSAMLYDKVYHVYEKYRDVFLGHCYRALEEWYHTDGALPTHIYIAGEIPPRNVLRIHTNDLDPIIPFFKKVKHDNLQEGNENTIITDIENITVGQEQSNVWQMIQAYMCVI